MENLGLARSPSKAFWSGQRVFLTGHTGFKGSWLSLWLEQLEAEVFGLALPADTTPNLFGLLSPFAFQTSQFGDIRDLTTVVDAVERADPTIAIHMAAQPLIRRSYRQPVETFSTNVMGTVHVLEALRRAPRLKAALVVTTDKVYQNDNSSRHFVESDPLGGGDPYSGSKAATEMITHAYGQSFFESRGIPLATARAGNVVGGGDWSEDRLVPDLWRASRAGKAVELRYPDATRPWQHVLDPLGGYLSFVERLATRSEGLPRALNFGPAGSDALTVLDVAKTVLSALPGASGWTAAPSTAAPEMHHLALDATLASRSLEWRARLTAKEAMRWTAAWYCAFVEGAEMRDYSLEQIENFGKL